MFPKKNIGKLPEGAVWGLSQTFDADSKLKIRSNKCQQYLIARGYKPHELSKRFYDVAKISKVSSFWPEFNPLLPNLNKLIRNRSHFFIVILRWHKNQLKQFRKEVTIWNKFCPFLHFYPKNLSVDSFIGGNKRFDKYTNFIVFNNTFKCTATGKCYQVSATK